jgi:pilus assembly protein CpaD
MTSLRRNKARRRAALRLFAAATLIGVLGGCQSQTAKNEYPFDYRDRHPITVREGARHVDVFVGRNRGGLTPAQRADVLAFAQWWKREANSGIVVQVPRGGPTDRAAADSMREIHSIFAQSGVPGKAVYVQPFRPSPTSLVSIKIEYSKMVAETGPCGQWPEDMGPSMEKSYSQNRPYWNFGCASQRNLASMVDNPADLVQPRGEQPAYAARRSVALDKYRKGDNPSGSYPNSSSGFDNGKISDLGK